MLDDFWMQFERVLKLDFIDEHEITSALQFALIEDYSF